MLGDRGGSGVVAVLLEINIEHADRRGRPAVDLFIVGQRRLADRIVRQKRGGRVLERPMPLIEINRAARAKCHVRRREQVTTLGGVDVVAGLRQDQIPTQLPRLRHRLFRPRPFRGRTRREPRRKIEREPIEARIKTALIRKISRGVVVRARSHETLDVCLADGLEFGIIERLVKDRHRDGGLDVEKSFLAARPPFDDALNHFLETRFIRLARRLGQKTLE